MNEGNREIEEINFSLAYHSLKNSVLEEVIEE